MLWCTTALRRGRPSLVDLMLALVKAGMVPRYPFSLPSTRAREASGAMPADFFDRREPPWAADGEVDVAAVADSFLRIADRRDDGARAVGATDDDAR